MTWNTAMDVNKPESVIAVGDQPYRSPSERRDPDAREDADEDARPDTWSADAAVDLDGALAGGVTPEIQRILDAFAARIEPLRAELDVARHREAHYKEIAIAHPFLPVPNRREFLRELKHVLEHIGSLSPSVALLVAHAGNVADIRRRLGRKAADAALIQFADAIVQAIHPTEAVGSLCGEDFSYVTGTEIFITGGQHLF